MSVSWAPATDAIEETLGSLGKRGKKRTGVQTGPTTYSVYGDPKLGDSFDEYKVQLEGKKYSCSCQSHNGGQYRNMCSHITYVVLARRGVVAWAEDYVAPVAEVPPIAPAPVLESGFQDLPCFQDLPSFVDQGQEWTEQAREDLDAHFGDQIWVGGPLPSWVKFIREHQWDAYCETLRHLDDGKKVVFLSAPTGSGKTLIGEMVRRSFSPEDTLYTCTTKTLQNQFEEDFNYAKVIKGRSNYRTLNFPNAQWLACDLCEKKNLMDSCRYCSNTPKCPYVVAREEAEQAPLAVANVAYLLAEGNTRSSRFAGRRLVVLDEADAIEDELMRYVEVSISPRMQKTLGLKPPEKKTVAESWDDWRLNEALPKIRHHRKSISGQEPKDIRLRITLQRLEDQLEKVSFDEDWVYTGYSDDKKTSYITFKPVKVDVSAPDSLWPLAQQWVLMSATIISAQQMAEDLGLEDHEWAIVNVPSTFPPDNRPIYVEPVANMTAKTEETARPALVKRVKEILAWHDERILVHTVSYRLAKFLADSIGPRAITYRSSSEREEALEDFRESKNGVLVAPSFERGIDLPYDQCRVVVVTKVPFPYLGDKQINKRLYSRGGQGWYAMQTVRSLVQMTGRAMRHADDSCEVYILDKQFVSNVWKKSRHLLPEWWKIALEMRGSPNLASIRASGLS